MKEINTYIDLYTEFPAKVIEIENVEITECLNEHGICKASLYIISENDFNFINKITSETDIKIVIKTEEKTDVIFAGIMTNLTAKKIEYTYKIDIELKSKTFRLDCEKKSKSFQNKDNKYTDLFTKIIDEDNNENSFDNASNGCLQEESFIQYKETDWQFIKRMASHFNAVIIPDVLFPSPKIKIGVPEGKERGKVEKYNFYVTKNLERFMVSSKNESNKITELDTVSIHIETTDDFEIGDTLTYQYDKESNMIPSLFIKKKYTRLSEGALRFEYELSTDKGISQDKFYNEKITGLSLQGKVLSRIQDTVRVLLEIDDEQDASKAWDFPYTTPYTAEGSGGWYVMPEIGDTVYIYFPNREEHFGVGLNSIRLKNEGTDKIGNPNVKYLRTKDGKEIKLAPDELTITCSNWKNEKTGEENIIYIRLNQDSGITIQSTKPINFNSDGNINFTADKNIKFEALEEIKLKCQSSQIIMGSSISIDSPDVKIN